MVFHAPFELDNDVFSSQVLKEGFWIDLQTLVDVNRGKGERGGIPALTGP